MKKQISEIVMILAILIILIPPIYSNTAAQTALEGAVKKFEYNYTNNLGYRLEAIRLYERLESKITNFDHTCGSPDLKGLNGQNYYYNTFLTNKFQGNNIPDDKELAEIAENLNRVSAFLKNRDILTIVVFCTDKETIYPEYYPNTVKHHGVDYIDTVTNYLQNNTDIDYVFNTKERFLQLKSEYVLYNKRHDVAHLNELSAYFTYYELMNCINDKFPALAPKELDAFSLSYLDMVIESIPVLTPHDEKKAIRLDSTVFTDNGIPVNNWDNQAFTTNDTSAPNIMVFRDSFFGGYTNLDSGYSKHGQPEEYVSGLVSNYLPEHFNNTYLVHHNDFALFEDCINYYDPQIVIIEFGERQLFQLNRILDKYVA